MHRLSTFNSGKLPPTNTLAPSVIETLPYSVLEFIFMLACTDGGRTGRSLSLVSKTIHVTSQAARFHSVSLLIGTSAQLVRFMQALDAARADARAQDVSIPYVRHLCVSLTPAFDIPNLKLIDEDSATARLMRPLSPQGYSTRMIEVWHEYHRMFQSLCAAIFHDLETLCLLRHSKYIYDLISRKTVDAIPEISLPYGFPRLRELTFSHDLRPPFVHAGDTSPDPMTEGRQGTTALYPALRRLHMSTSPRAEMDFEWWALNAPHLTWLRIHTSRWATSPSGIRFIPSLTLVLGNRHAGDADPHKPCAGPCFSELKTLMFMLEPSFESDKPPPASVAAHETFASELNTTLTALGVPTTVFQPNYAIQDVIVPNKYRQLKHLDEGMRRDWLFGVEGCEGTFTPEFWAPRPPGVLETLWNVMRGGRIFGAS